MNINSYKLSLYKTDLTYDIPMYTLFGLLNGERVSIMAFSGGGGGKSKDRGPDDIWAANNVFATNQRTIKKADGNYKQRGGPLPAGIYTLGKPILYPKLSSITKVVPIIKGLVMNMDRDGFYIHGRGNHGSDGCIVPRNPTDLHQLINGITKSGGGILRVIPTDFEFQSFAEGLHQVRSQSLLPNMLHL